MTTNDPQNSLPAEIADAIASVPKAWIPNTFKAADRLLGAAVDIPAAWLNQKKAQIDAQTEAFKLVEASISRAAAEGAALDAETVQRATRVLLRKSYRAQTNRDAVAAAMLADLTDTGDESVGQMGSDQNHEIDDDWLNVFERYAEDASTERMQALWGRVIAGEVKRPGRYALRTLRFLSEFSQVDALDFAELASWSFGDFLPDLIIKERYKDDIRTLIYLSSLGLVQVGSGAGLQRIFDFRSDGTSWIREGNLAVLFVGNPGEEIRTTGFILTPLGQELMSLLPARDRKAAAQKVALAMRQPTIREAHLVRVGENGHIIPMEIIWQPPLESGQTAS